MHLKSVYQHGKRAVADSTLSRAISYTFGLTSVLGGGKFIPAIWELRECGSDYIHTV